MSNVLLTPQALHCCCFCLDNKTADNFDPLERLLDGKVLFPYCGFMSHTHLVSELFPSLAFVKIKSI